MPAHPILIGQGQLTSRAKTLEDFIHPIEFMKRAVEAAAEDAGGGRALLDKADALHVVNMLSWNHKNAPGALAESLGVSPATLEYTSVGGNNPQWLVNRIADRMSRGECEIAIIAGCEVLRSVKLAMKFGKDVGAFRDKVEVPFVGVNRPGTTQTENEHFADRPVRIYPLIENALRAREGLSIAEQRRALGKFAEDFSSVAAANPLSWFPVRRSAEEATTPSPQNRMIGWPYPKYLNAVMEVDQAAALIMTTTEVAARMGIPKDRWVYLHGGQDAMDHWFVSERAELADSVAIKGCVTDALAQAGVGLEDMAFFDLYSCFPVMPRLTRHVLGMSHDDPRPMTITGGLPYFGGAGNNYVTHSIAEAVVRLRANPDQFGMITSNGFYSTKHGVGVYGGREPKRPWSRVDPHAFQESLPLPPAVETETSPAAGSGFLVESYTVWHDQGGAPEYGILFGRADNGKRAWAQTRKADKDLMAAMMSEEWIGKRGRFAEEKQGKANLVDFS